MIDSLPLLKRLHTYYETISPDLVVLDLETDSPIEKIANVYGIGLCFNLKKAFYIAWRNPDGSHVWSVSQRKEIADWIESICTKSKLIGHNISFDTIVFRNETTLNLTPLIYSDTILLKHSIDEERPFALKEIGVRELGEWADSAQDDLKEAVLAAGGSWKKAQKDMYLAPTEILGKYCCWDVLLTLELFNIYQAKLISEGLHDLFYKEEVMPLYKEVTIPMKEVGVRIDVAHFEKLKSDIETDMTALTTKIQKDVAQDVYNFVQSILNKDCPVKNKGNFPKILAGVLGVPLPINRKTGSYSLAAKALEKQATTTPQFKPFYDWLSGLVPLKKTFTKGKLSNAAGELCVTNRDLRYAQEKMYFNKSMNVGKTHVFNLNSTDHIAHLIFQIHKFPKDPRKTTDGGKPQVDVEVLESFAGGLPIIDDLLTLKKLAKLYSTYVMGILDRQIDGRIYASLLQFGTTSGRYACKNPNLNNLPRPPDKITTVVEEYTNAIRAGFIASEGHSLIDTDYSALEPRCFSAVSGDKGLIDLWAKGEDMYSRIAIDVFDLKNISANPNDKNYLKKVDPEYRQKSKVFCLAVPYGAEAGRISQAMKCSNKEAKSVINKYLSTYPGLKTYMKNQEHEAMTTGKVTTMFGRVRHLPKVKSIYAIYGIDILDYNWASQNRLLDVRRKFKNGLNNAKNFSIQGLAAHVLNRAMIAIARRFTAGNYKARMILPVHDQLIVDCPENELEEVFKIIQDCMENTTKISVPFIAEPEIAQNMAESH